MLIYFRLNVSTIYEELARSSDLTDVQKDALFEKKYKDRFFEIDGYVENIEKGIFGYNIEIKKIINTFYGPYGIIEEESVIYNVYIGYGYVDDKFKNSLLKYKKGDYIRVGGRITSYDTILSTLYLRMEDVITLK